MHRRSEAGISALELAVVILVIGLIASIALPNVIAATRSYRLQIATQALVQQLNLCRQKAVAANQQVSIQITATQTRIDTNRNGIFGDSGGSGVAADEPAVTFGTEAAYLASPAPPATVTFTSRGEMPIGAGARSFTVRYGNQRQRTISIDTRGAVMLGPEIAITN